MYLKFVSPHIYPPLVAAHSLSYFPLQQPSGPHCRQCLPLNGFGFGCHGDCHLEGVLTGSWVAGWAPGAVPGSPPPPPGPAALRPAAHLLHPLALMTGLPKERAGGAWLWSRSGRNSFNMRTDTKTWCQPLIRLNIVKIFVPSNGFILCIVSAMDILTNCCCILGEGNMERVFNWIILYCSIYMKFLKNISWCRYFLRIQQRITR